MPWTHADLEEQQEVESIRQQQVASYRLEKEAMLQQDTVYSRESSEDVPAVLPDLKSLPPPEWPESPSENNISAEE